MNKEFDIFFFEAFEEEEKELKKYLPQQINAGFSPKTIQEYGSENPPAQIISTRTQSVYPIEWAKKIKAILSRSTGYDHLTDYLKQCNSIIDCGYLPLYCHRAVAEHALMLWMALLRKLPDQIYNFLTFSRDGLTGKEAFQKKLVVYGVGNIGSEVCKIGLGLGMEVFGVEIDIKHPQFNYLEKENGVKTADIIVCAMNLTDINKNYFNAELLLKAKEGAIFVNVSRGEISPSLELLKVANHLGGIGLDVYNEEKMLANSLRNGEEIKNEEVNATLKLATMSNVILTPHNAFNSAEGVKRKSEQSIIQLVNYLEKDEFIWKVPVN